MSTIERAAAKLSEPKASSEKESDAQVVSQSSEKQAEHSRISNKTLLQIDLEGLAERGFVTAGEDRSRIKEEFRFIKRKLLKNAFNPVGELTRRANLMMVSSANPSEGKTFTALNLAMSIALEQDRTVLLVDADVLKPSMERELGLPKDIPGLMDYLKGKVDSIGEVIYSTNIPKLKVIPAGSAHHLTNELLASERMERLAEELASRYSDRVVVFDSPPLLGVNETQVLSHLVGQAVIVVHEGRTRQKDVSSAIALLDDELAIGFVLNKSAAARRAEGYGYGYGYGGRYGYGYGYGYGSDK